MEVTIAHDQSRDITYARKVDIRAEGHSISFTLEAGKLEKLCVNDRDLRHMFAAEAYFPVGTLAPLIRPRPPEEPDAPSIRRRLPPALYALTQLLRQRMHGNTSFSTALGRARSFAFGSSKQLFDLAKKLFRTYTWSENDPYFCELRDLTVAVFAPQLLDASNEALAAISRGIRYLEPLRATADRFYRFQDLAVDEIDSQGQNLPMFIHALSPEQLEEYQKWTKAHFGFSTKPDRHAGHLSLLLSESTGAPHNLADTGFGYSQVLPIATQLWWQSKDRGEMTPSSRRAGSTGGILAMEQPELHLHPRLQAHLADAFVAAVVNAKTNNNSFRVVAETHSEAIVNRLGELISQGTVKPTDVNVVLFERENAESPSKVTIAEYDEKGYLKNWPFGFFNPTKG